MSVYEARGYPFSFNAVATSFSSCARSTPEDDKTSALVISVLTTATLYATGWWESKDRYGLYRQLFCTRRW